MNTQCVVYVADLQYVFPTILSALQARDHALPSTDVVILMSEPLDVFDELKALLADRNVYLIDAEAELLSALGELDAKHFQGRISVSTMAKLVLDQVLPQQYTQIIYLDGDTQVIGSLAALENAYVPAGKFFAARDYTSISEMLNNGRESFYFNAGFLKFNREGWIGREALEVFRTNPAVCDGKHDQGALNYVCGSSLILVSNKWNFPKQFLHLAPRESLAVVHYMAHPKPWHGTFFPWSAAESRVYRQLRAADPVFRSLYKGISLERWLVYKLRSVRERLSHEFGGKISNPRVRGLLVGDYAV
ncbi:glycosyltransferase family 8 protein [Rhizobium halophytocola]|uniref:Lipopolysaccharide biosynthesis glycosyltransferase n=1 Tax=Rhizobium halophytocola TaxID=735519 RepID=A0ABS4E5G2_9HYPH|nr:glycosyltransferase [Rhizobium halophytocola]MBP1853188.1 lipopolysaccharide biosynthesis glycosyltransferase [Rhizobium halophytocola]